jgi:hypothetical protein
MREPLERIADELERMRLILEQRCALRPVMRKTAPPWRVVLFWLTLSAVTLLLWQIVRTGRGPSLP